MKNEPMIPKALINNMNEHLPGKMEMADLQRLLKGKRVKVPYKLSAMLMGSPLENADLSARALNSLRRAGYNTVGQVIDKVDSFDDLASIRGCGTNTVDEIRCKFFAFQYSIIEEGKKTAYMQELLKLNGIG